jgi:hypothetical protein
MSHVAHNRAWLAQRPVEIGVAAAIAVFGLIVIAGSVRAGIGWGTDGPRSGFFPFYVGATIIAASVVNLFHGFGSDPRRMFAEWGQLLQVVSVVIPTAVYVLAVPWIGLYVASIVLIAGFMVWLGKYRFASAAAIAVTIMVLVYLTFERWFLVPLPKGPLEELLGL